MGRKIKGKKHHGTKDPEKQRQAREAKVQLKINNRPSAEDFQELPKSMRMMMKAREVLLKIDVEAEIENLNEIHYTIAQSVWKLKTGQWPEMAKFVDNFFRKTYGSREFWVRLGTF